MLRENKRFLQNFTRFRIDRLLDSNDSSGSTSVALGPLDCFVGRLEFHLAALDEPSSLLLELLDDVKGLFCHHPYPLF